MEGAGMRNCNMLGKMIAQVGGACLSGTVINADIIHCNNGNGNGGGGGGGD